MSRPPQSATNFAVALAAMAAGLATIWFISPVKWSALSRTVPYIGVVPCAVIVAVIAVAELLMPRLRGTAGGAATEPGQARSLDLGRVGIRLLGLVATLALLAFAYWLLPEYHSDFYGAYWLFLRTIAPLAVLVPFYFLWVDKYGKEIRDEYLAFGSLLLTWRAEQWHSADWPLIRRHLLGWTVKGFFLPLMTVYFANELQSVFNILAANGAGSMPQYQLFYHVSYAVDLLFCVIGYTVAVRLFDSHIRSVEPTLIGWMVALMCYQPFYSAIGQAYFQYDDEIFWDNWLEGWPMVRTAWAIAIVALLFIYALSTVSFGLRFSNLTHRGIITAGPYRFSKHPAYISKNLSWWLISIPFVSSQGWSEAVRNCGVLLLLNLVYYARARTEERHLSADPTYIAYALWMNERGLLRLIARLFPFLRYKAPQAIAT
jgi:protein-S-isoprenylcysteine O-methyltransferase Ste14